MIKYKAGETELGIKIDAGPRIMSLTHRGGKNLLYEDHTHFKVGDWQMYGGHRFTIAPESEASYYPDNELCEVFKAAGELIIKAPARPDNIRLSIRISEAAEGGFNVLHVLENTGTENWTGALWAVTCVPRTAEILASCTTPDIQYLPGTDETKWHHTGKYIMPAEGEHRGKVSWLQDKGWLSSGELVIHKKDEGSLEIFVCKDYAELETVSPLQTIAPGAKAQHLQHWRIFL